MADMFVSSGKCRNALVVGSEIYSKILDWSDRSTCVLFGDGAGAVVLSQSDQPGILSTHLHANGSHSNILSAPDASVAGRCKAHPTLIWKAMPFLNLPLKFWKKSCRKR